MTTKPLRKRNDDGAKRLRQFIYRITSTRLQAIVIPESANRFAVVFSRLMVMSYPEADSLNTIFNLRFKHTDPLVDKVAGHPRRIALKSPAAIAVI